ncbi:DDE-type integrase/transposase/recombinase [Vibrio alginolyticus]|nr:DDE-type integrase/transposase/recombinase [Vibrio alginolyticus]
MINESSSWRLDETYVIVKEKWLYLYLIINNA